MKWNAHLPKRASVAANVEIMAAFRMVQYKIVRLEKTHYAFGGPVVETSRHTVLRRYECGSRNV
jgi:hypothetical protein